LGAILPKSRNMNKTLVVLLGVAAGATLTALLASSKRGKEIRSTLVKKANELKDTLATNIEQKARNVHDSGVTYI